MRWQAGLGREGHETRDGLLDLEAVLGQPFGERAVRERQHVVVVVPVATGLVQDIRLHADKASAFFEHAADLQEHGVHLLFGLQMLEEVADEAAVHALIVDSAQVVCGAADEAHRRAERLRDLRVEIDGDLLTTANVTYELALATGQIQHRVGWTDELLEVVLAEHLPDLILTHAVFVREPVPVQ
jgi:hypothetical protein